MLRRVLLVIGVLALLAAAVCLAQQWIAPALWLAVNGLAMTLGVLFERWRYRQPADGTPARFVPNGERFHDPESGALLEVRTDPATGERRYVKLPPA